MKRRNQKKNKFGNKKNKTKSGSKTNSEKNVETKDSNKLMDSGKSEEEKVTSIGTENEENEKEEAEEECLFIYDKMLNNIRSNILFY